MCVPVQSKLVRSPSPYRDRRSLRTPPWLLRSQETAYTEWHASGHLSTKLFQRSPSSALALVVLWSIAKGACECSDDYGSLPDARASFSVIFFLLRLGSSVHLSVLTVTNLAQVLVKTANLTDRASGGGKNKRSPSRSLASTLGFGRRDNKDRDKSPPPAVTQSKGTKTRRRRAFSSSSTAPTKYQIRRVACLFCRSRALSICSFCCCCTIARYSQPVPRTDAPREPLFPIHKR